MSLELLWVEGASCQPGGRRGLSLGCGTSLPLQHREGRRRGWGCGAKSCPMIIPDIKVQLLGLLAELKKKASGAEGAKAEAIAKLFIRLVMNIRQPSRPRPKPLPGAFPRAEPFPFGAVAAFLLGELGEAEEQLAGTRTTGCHQLKQGAHPLVPPH